MVYTSEAQGIRLARNCPGLVGPYNAMRVQHLERLSENRQAQRRELVYTLDIATNHEGRSMTQQAQHAARRAQHLAQMDAQREARTFSWVHKHRGEKKQAPQAPAPIL